MRVRQSNIELLRLVCMFLIIWVHFVWHGIFENSASYSTQIGYGALPLHLITGICLCAVNTFVIISGFFSIRPKANSFFNLYWTVAFYAGVLYIAFQLLNKIQFNRWNIYNALMPFGLMKSSNNWWFIPNYLILYILSPILNIVTNTISRKKFKLFLLLMSVPVFYFGWYRNMGWSEMGFNFINFIFLYFIGRYIAMHDKKSANVRFYWMRYAVLFLASSLTMGVILWYGNTIGHPFQWMWYSGQYNSPLCIFASICLFMTFKSLTIKSGNIINFFAASALSIYLVHDCAYLRTYLWEFIGALYDNLPLFKALCIMLVLSVSMMVVIPLIDKLRFAITNPICRLSCNLWYKVKPRLVSLLYS